MNIKQLRKIIKEELIKIDEYSRAGSNIKCSECGHENLAERETCEECDATLLDIDDLRATAPAPNFDPKQAYRLAAQRNAVAKIKSPKVPREFARDDEDKRLTMRAPKR